MSNDGRRSSATKTSPDCQRNRNNNHPSPKTSQSYPKLSKEIYIELAAFSDSIYDRGRLFKEMLQSNILFPDLYVYFIQIRNRSKV